MCFETKLLRNERNPFFILMHLVVFVWWITYTLSLIHGSDNMYNLTQAQLIIGALIGLRFRYIESEPKLFLLRSACFAGSTLASNLSLHVLPLSTYTLLKWVETGILFLIPRWKRQTIIGLVVSISVSTYFSPPIALSLLATLGNVILILCNNQTATKGFNDALGLYAAMCLVGGLLLGSFLVLLHAVGLFMLPPVTDISWAGWRSACFFTLANLCAFQLHQFPSLYALANLGRRVFSILWSFRK